MLSLEAHIEKFFQAHNMISRGLRVCFTMIQFDFLVLMLADIINIRHLLYSTSVNNN